MIHNRSADGLRGIAAISVVFSHFCCAYLPFLMHGFYPDTFHEIHHPDFWYYCTQQPFLSVFYSGHFAVAIFFVLSGYVLAMPYYLQQPEKITRRLWGRYLRLNLPIAVTILISYLLFSGHLYFYLPASEISHSSWLHDSMLASTVNFSSMISCAVYAAITLGRQPYNPPLWTIQVEFVGSLILLAYYAVKPRGRDGLTFAFVAVLLWAVCPDSCVYYISIFFGSYINKWKPSQKLLISSLLLGIYFGGFAYDNALYRFLPDFSLQDQKTFYDTVGAALVVLAVVNGAGAKIFQHPTIQYFGRISYAVYLLHFLVLCSLSCWLYSVLPPTVGSLIGNFAVYFAVVIFLAHYFEKQVDRRAILVSHKFGDFLFRGTRMAA